MIGGVSNGGVEFRLTQQMEVWASSSYVAWAYAEWSFGSSSYENLASGVGSGGHVTWSMPYYNTWYASYFYDYSIGNFWSLMFSKWNRV
jgi:hypothetical protein